MIKRSIILATLFAVAISITSCSKSTEPATPTTAAAGQQSTTASGGSGNASTTAAGDLTNCKNWLKTYYSVQGLIGVEAAQSAQQNIPKLDAAVPAAIKTDWNTLSPLYKVVAVSIVANGQTADQTNTAVAALNGKDPAKAISNIEAWAATNCR